MKIALAQINPIVGDLEGNLSLINESVQNAARKGVDLVVFPEMALSGYPPKDLLDSPDFIEKQIKTLEKLAKSITKTAIVIGYVDVNKKGHGKPLVNSAALICNGEIVFKQNKTLLPTYDVFDETRYFEPAEKYNIFEFKGKKLAITICEDMWFDYLPLYSSNPAEILAKKNPDLFIHINASPFTLGKIETRINIIRDCAQRYGIPVISVYQVGGNDELIFDGTSFVVESDGKVSAQAYSFKSDLIIYDTELKKGDLRTIPEDIPERAWEALKVGLRDYIRKSGFSKVVIGLSGGIDSAITAVLAAHALGKENVTTVSMPSMYSSEGSVTDAKILAENLGIRFEIVPITDIFNSFRDSLSSLFEGLPEGLAEENLQARIRGTILMALSNKFGCMLLQTGNKSEIAMGYCTLYGDMCGGLSVIGDVPKTLVYELSNWINRDKEIIPKSIITKPPSAELRPNQKDTDSLPPYETLDPILQLFIEERKTLDEIVAKGFDESLVRNIIKTVNQNEYKRYQAPPSLKITSKAFGTGRRMPLVMKPDYNK